MMSNLRFLTMRVERVLGIHSMPLAVCLFLTLSLNACKKDDLGFDTTHPTTTTDPAQYDVPFSGVPGASDVVMYEVNLGAFSAQGNLSGVRAKLSAIKDLGVNVVWLMPIYPIGELNGVGSPYAVKNYKEVNSSFGTLDDLRLLVKEAHALNMAVILDWVANHTSWDNAWIQNKSWYTQDASGTIVSPNGWTDVADLNYGNSAMRQEMIKAMKYWVLTANVDGYRCDHTDGVPVDFWKQSIDTLRKIPNRKLLMFAESSDKAMFTAGFDLNFGWNFYSKLKNVFNNNLPVTDLVAVNASDNANVPTGCRVLRWTSNHDDDAWDDTPVSIFKGNAGSMAAFVLTLNMGGSPLLYNGQEVGCPVKLSFFRGSTTKIDWSLNADMLSQYQQILNFRNTSSALKNGAVESLSTDANILAFTRTDGAEKVLTLVNVRGTQQTIQLPVSVANTTWTDALTGQPFSLGSSISLSAFSYLILKK